MWFSCTNPPPFLPHRTSETTAAIQKRTSESTEALQKITKDASDLIQKRTAETTAIIKENIARRTTYAASVLVSWKEHIETTAVNPLLSSLGQIAARAQAVSFLQGRQPSEQFKEFASQDMCHSVTLPRREKFTQTFVVEAGMTLFYEFAVEDMDIGMKVMLRSQVDGGSKEEELVDFKKYASNQVHKGSINAGDFEKVFVFMFDNGYSLVRSKTVGYRFTVLDPEVIEKEVEETKKAGETVEAEVEEKAEVEENAQKDASTAE